VREAIPEDFADGIDPPSPWIVSEGYANGIVEFRFKISEVVETHELCSGDDGREGNRYFSV